MPLDDLIEHAMVTLGSDDFEMLVDAVKPLRDNPGAQEQALVHAFNQGVADHLIPVAA